MNLAWRECRTADNNATAEINDQSTFTDGVCNDPDRMFPTKRLVISMKNATRLADWGGTTIQVNFYVSPSTPAVDFWDFSPSGCRAGSVFAPNVSVNASQCSNPYRPGPPNNDPFGETESWNVDASQLASCRISYQSDHVRNVTPIDLTPPTAPGGWLVNNIAIDDANNDVCAGCAGRLCIELEFLKYFSLVESRTVLTTELRHWVTVNRLDHCELTGGCGKTPVRASTWGRLKTLYR